MDIDNDDLLTDFKMIIMFCISQHSTFNYLSWLIPRPDWESMSSIFLVWNCGLVCNEEYYHIIYNYICSLITLHLPLLQSSWLHVFHLQPKVSDDEEAIIHWRPSELILIKVMISLAWSSLRREDLQVCGILSWVLMCLIYSNKTIRIIYQTGILTASNESLSAGSPHSVTSAYLWRGESPPVPVRWDKVLHYHNIRMFCLKITVITLDYPNKLSDNPKQILRPAREGLGSVLLFSLLERSLRYVLIQCWRVSVGPGQSRCGLHRSGIKAWPGLTLSDNHT